MIFSQAIKKRKAFCLDEAGHERDKRSEDDFDPAAVVAAIKSTKMSMELSSRELAVLNVKKSVIEMHSLLGVISMLRDRKMLTGQACSRALNDVPVGMLSKPSPSQATSLKSECFKKASSFLALSISESMQCIEHRRLYAAGVGSMKRRWQLSIRKPVLRQVDSAAYDSAVVDCSYSLNGGKYTGDAWREVLHVGPEGPLLRTIATLPVQPRYTLQLSIVHKRNGIVSAVSLWELLHLNDSEFPRSTGSSQTHLLLEQLQHSFCMRSHDALCREVFDQLVAEVLQCAFSASVVHGISGAKVKHIFVDDSHADPSLLLMEKLVSSFEVISLSRVNVTVLLSETHFLCVELIDIESATLEPHSKPLADSAPTPTPFLWRRKKAHSTEDDVKMDVEAESNSSGCFPNYLRNSLSSGLLCFAFSTLKSWELQQINKDGNGNRRDETARVRDESRYLFFATYFWPTIFLHYLTHITM